jgi:hypothetical protein
MYSRMKRKCSFMVLVVMVVSLINCEAVIRL